MSYERKVSIVALVLAFVMLAAAIHFLRRGDLPMALSGAGPAMGAAIVAGWPQHFAYLFRKPAREALLEVQSLPLLIGLGVYASLLIGTVGMVWSWLAK
jgi:hypothetical protein